MPVDPIADLYLGEMLGGRYEVLDFIAPGGFCLVFRARDHQQETDVALKILKPGVAGDAVIEFETEGILLDQLRGASRVLTLLGDVANTDTITVQKPGVPVPLPLPVRYLVVELADACLSDIVVERNALDWASRLGLFRDVVLGVHQMHLQRLVHRDLKSDNVLLRIGPKNATDALVADLGRGRDTRLPTRFLSEAYLAGRGDFRFAPPELLNLIGLDDAAMFRRADLFLVGSVLFELATGQGITSIVYGDPRAILSQAATIDSADRGVEYRSRVADTRALFQPAFELAEDEFSPAIRNEAGRLLRQLCDPEPLARERRCRAESRQPTWGLHWLLRRADILVKLERLKVPRARYSREKAS